MPLNEMQSHTWEYDLWESSNLETLLEASIVREKARRSNVPREAAAPPVPISKRQEEQQPNCTPSSTETVAQSTHAQLIGGCGIAAIDGYLAMRDYAASKGIDLIELHHKGIDLQDLISTLVIHTQKMAELEGRQSAGAQRWKR